VQRVKYVIQKEFRQLRRDPSMIRVSLMAPILQLVLFGYAVTTDVRNVNVFVANRDGGTESRQLLQEVAAVGYFDLHEVGRDRAPLFRGLETGQAQLALDIPPEFGRHLARGETATVQIIADGSDSNNATVAMAYLDGTVRTFSSQVALEWRQARTPGAFVPPLDPQPRVWFNPELKSIDYMVPSMVGLVLWVIALNLSAMAVVKEREIGTLEQVSVTPLKSWQLLFGKTVPGAVVGMLDAILIVVVAELWFHVPLRGSVLLLFASATGFLLAALGTGLLISTVARSQLQAQMMNFFVTMPSVLLSGIVFPIENMPRPIQVVTYVIPLRYFAYMVRGIYLKGDGLLDVLPQGLALFGLGILTYTLGILAFRKRVG
jgi:ABC-2 type transport system permease protein